MNLDTAIRLYADANINQSDKGSSIINIPEKLQTPQLRDVARRRIVKTNPDVDSAATKKKKPKLIEKIWDESLNKKNSADSQADNNAFVGKKYRVQDTHYGHLISEHDNKDDAERAAIGRPWSRVIQAPEWNQSQQVRNIIRKKVINSHVFKRRD